MGRLPIAGVQVRSTQLACRQTHLHGGKSQAACACACTTGSCKGNRSLALSAWCLQCPELCTLPLCPSIMSLRGESLQPSLGRHIPFPCTQSFQRSGRHNKPNYPPPKMEAGVVNTILAHNVQNVQKVLPLCGHCPTGPSLMFTLSKISFHTTEYQDYCILSKNLTIESGPTCNPE